MSTTSGVSPVNRNTGSVTINQINEYVSNFDKSDSPIDQFYNNTMDIIRVANPAFLLEHNSMGPLLLVGLVSATENYFRDILSNIILFCSISKAASSEQMISLGSVVWLNGYNLGRGAFENISFASMDGITKACRNFIKFETNNKPSIRSVLESFEKVCELRHGIVHSNSIVAGKNAIKLGLRPTGKPMQINIGYNELQECASICNATVTTFNSELFNEMIRRWAIEWKKHDTLDERERNKLFTRVWNCFYSQVDSQNNLIIDKVGMVKFRNMIKKQYNI